MPSWNELLDSLEKLPQNPPADWLRRQTIETLEKVSELRGKRNVLYYASAFLQKPIAPAPNLQLTHEDLNGFMSVMFGMDWDKGLTLLLHTPGGVTNAAETIVAYLWSKFPDIEVIIPAYAMSAGTMISLASSKIVMGRQSQLGPIDPQMLVGGGFVSARAIVDQFDRAQKEILANPSAGHVWFPVLQSVGPALLQEAHNALDYGEKMVARWLADHMFSGEPDPQALADETARYFNDASIHKSHGRRIDRDEARHQSVHIVNLEDDQNLQDAVLTAYHLSTIVFEKSPAAKVLVSHKDRMWVKNLSGGSGQ